jgi:hypothetical protein
MRRLPKKRKRKEKHYNSADRNRLRDWHNGGGNNTTVREHDSISDSMGRGTSGDDTSVGILLLLRVARENNNERYPSNERRAHVCRGDKDANAA